MNAGTKAINALLLVGAATVLLAAPAISHAEESETAQDVTAQAVVSAPVEARAVKRTRDGNVNTYTTFAAEEPFSCTWLQETEVRGVYVKWYTLPDSVILVQMDENGVELNRETVDEPVFNDYYPLLETTRGLQIWSDSGMQIAELTLYSAGELPDGIYDWQPPVQKADLLVVSAHCDDELLFFGGTIPYYAGERGLAVQVAYMANGERARVDEALSGLWHCGVRNAPVFLPLPDIYTETLRDALIRWGEDTTLDTLVSLIRRFEPEVIVTHDLNGEYGHGAHMATAYCMQEALPLAADAAAYPDSLKQYGVWQTQKLYLHLYAENAITMDWNISLDAFDGKSALEVANEAYHMHVSQLEYHRNIYSAGDLSSAEYGLAYTAVGADEAKNDFFEHIDFTRLTTYVAPAATDTPEITATPEPTPTQTPEQTAAASQEVSIQSNFNPLTYAILGILALAAAVLICLMIRRRKKQNNRS